MTTIIILNLIIIVFTSWRETHARGTTGEKLTGKPDERSWNSNHFNLENVEMIVKMMTLRIQITMLLTKMLMV